MAEPITPTPPTMINLRLAKSYQFYFNATDCKGITGRITKGTHILVDLSDMYGPESASVYEITTVLQDGYFHGEDVWGQHNGDDHEWAADEGHTEYSPLPEKWVFLDRIDFSQDSAWHDQIGARIRELYDRPKRDPAAINRMVLRRLVEIQVDKMNMEKEP